MNTFPASAPRVRVIIAFMLNSLLLQGTFSAQAQFPLMHATSRKVVIKDGYVIREGIWELSPEAKPDIYTPLEPGIQKTVVFMTDLDTLSFEVFPGKLYDFIILLNNKDTCLTRISTLKAETSSSSSGGPGAELDVSKLAMDFAVFREALKKYHPALYRYQTQRSLNRFIDSCFLAIDKPMTRYEFGKLILLVTSAIQDGHTGTNLSSMLIKKYAEEEKLFPEELYFAGNKAYVVCGQDKNLEAGDEILTINGLSASAILSKLFKYLPSDGAIVTKKLQTVNNNGAFPILFRWIFGASDYFEIKTRRNSGAIETVSIAAQFAKDFSCYKKREKPQTKDLSFRYENGHTAILTIRTFDKSRLTRPGFDLPNFLRDRFQELSEQKPATLIIDLRDNGGGLDEYGALLYSYLADKPFNYLASAASKDKAFTEKENMLLGVQNPRHPVYSGDVLVLTNGQSFSTTAVFCAIARSNKRAWFVGEETGGGYHGNAAGQTIKVELPNSKVQVTIPRFMYVNSVAKSKYANRGIIPDFKVVPDVHDILANSDSQLKYAMMLAKKVSRYKSNR